jgi:hypothetical protein
MYKIRVILDTKEDIIRTILVDDHLNLETLHFTIAKSFDFGGSEMASFYRTDDEWNEGEEIPLFNMSEAGEGIYMKNCLIKNTIPTSGDKLIYVYDFLSMWTFLIELMDTAEHQSGTSYPSLIYSHGMLPEDAPDKQFEAESENDLEWESEDEDLYDDNAEDLWN